MLSTRPAISLRPLIFWPHLIAGVLAGAVILLMCVTGVLLTYERQLIAWADSELRSVPPAAGAARLPIETVIARVSQERPRAVASAITVGSAPDAPVVVTVAQQTLYADAYTGRLLGEGSQSVRRVMSELRAWHRWLAVADAGRPAARAITGWSNVIFLFIVASGFYLWFPRQWTWLRVKAVVLFNGRLRGKPRDFNRHNVIGVWSAPVLFVLVLSAMPISFPWANALVYRLVGEEPPARAAAGRAESRRPAAANTAGPEALHGLNALLAVAERQVPGWRTIALRLPDGKDGPVVFTIDRGNGGQPQLRSTLTVSRSGGVVRHEQFSDQSLGRRLRSISRFAHTGEVLGIAGQTVAGLASAGGVVLVWTGLALAWRRLLGWLPRRAARVVASRPHSPATGPQGVTVVD